MPNEMLQELATHRFPLLLSDVARIDKLRILRAAELVDAHLPEPGEPGPAVVLAITAQGRAELRRLKQGPRTPPR